MYAAVSEDRLYSRNGSPRFEASSESMPSNALRSAGTAPGMKYPLRATEASDMSGTRQRITGQPSANAHWYP